MPHEPPTPSAPGTPLADQSVGEIVAGQPNFSRVFQAFDIGFCCQGKLTLREACVRKGVDLEAMLEALSREAAGSPPPAANPAELPLDRLATYIVEHHHGFLRRELPRIHAMAERVAQVHGGHTPALVEVCRVYTAMAQELAQHALKEEEILFPAISGLAAEGSPGPNLDAPIACMIEDHESANAALARLRELTHGFQPPADACNTYRALFAGLADLESDTHQHIHLENNVLFPRARELAS